MNWYDGRVSGVSQLWGNGTSCGTCYWVRCQIPLCDVNGVYLAVTDKAYGDETDFVMSERAFKKMAANESAAEELMKKGTVDIVYERVPCTYASRIVFHIQETSSNPGYFAMPDSGQWKALNMSYGAVFDFPNPPSSEIWLRFKVSGILEWVDPKIVIPSNWIPGASYVTKVQFK
ncbi:hypothetical protein Fmac_027368 [Flemingia macrophylla]|uniref:Expansin-like B1 n=1 Tax=Flemingia macrophylla TaxID=520843 RepID=A0ABD1LHK1_9FABA